VDGNVDVPLAHAADPPGLKPVFAIEIQTRCRSESGGRNAREESSVVLSGRDRGHSALAGAALAQPCTGRELAVTAA